MKVKEIVEKYLRENGYEGLFAPGECACIISELMPCERVSALYCQPGIIYPADPESEFGFMVGYKADEKDRYRNGSVVPPGEGDYTRGQPKEITGEEINARAFYLAMIDRAIEAAMTAQRYYHLAANSFHVEHCPSRGVSYMEDVADFLRIEKQWMFYARMWAHKWNVVHKPAPAWFLS